MWIMHFLLNNLVKISQLIEVISIFLLLSYKSFNSSKCFPSKLQISTKAAVTIYGSIFDAGLLSSKNPFPSSLA